MSAVDTKTHAGTPLLIVSVMMATLMQAIDTTIANVALPDMQGSLSATQDQVAWVLTSYIVAAAISTPATGWFADTLGRRRLLLFAIGGFTIASVLCGIAADIGQMVTFRLLQGLFGAALVPVSQSVLLDSYPREKHGSAMALWGVGIMVGPILGPPLGGWLTEAASWRWVFFINVPVGILAWLGVAASVPEGRGTVRPFDWRGFAFLAIGIGALQLMLDRGETMDWFSSPEIQLEAAMGFLGTYLYLAHFAGARYPFLDLGLFRDRNFALGAVFICLIGVVLFSTLALLPQYLQHLMGYPVVATGMLLAPRGIGTMIGMIAVGRLINRVDARWCILVGMLMTMASLYDMAQFAPTVSAARVGWIGVLQGLGLGLVFVPLSTVAFSTLAPAQRTEAASLFSLLRNLGSSVGISVVFALLSRGTQQNHAALAAGLGAYTDTVHQLPAAWSAGTVAGLNALNAEVTRQAYAIAMLDDFRLLLLVTALTLPLLIWFRPRPMAAPSAAAAAADAH